MRGVIVACLLMAPALAGCLGGFGLSGRVTPEDLLTDSEYSEWVIEIDYVPGFQPDSSALNTLKSRLQELAKKDTIRFVQTAQLPASDKSYDIDDLLSLKRQYQDFKTTGSTVVTWVAYLDGEWGSGGVLGVALSDHETVGIMKAEIQSTAGSLLSPYSVRQIETPVIVHEMGHIIGLVNNGLKMQTNHEASTCDGNSDKGHSSNTNSVMTCAVESSNIIQAFSGGPPTTFDSNDKADVCAAGGKCQ